MNNSASGASQNDSFLVALEQLRSGLLEKRKEAESQGQENIDFSLVADVEVPSQGSTMLRESNVDRDVAPQQSQLSEAIVARTSPEQQVQPVKLTVTTTSTTSIEAKKLQETGRISGDTRAEWSTVRVLYDPESPVNIVARKVVMENSELRSILMAPLPETTPAHININGTQLRVIGFLRPTVDVRFGRLKLNRCLVLEHDDAFEFTDLIVGRKVALGVGILRKNVPGAKETSIVAEALGKSSSGTEEADITPDL